MQVLRAIEQALGDERSKRTGRGRQIGVHGNRLIAHLIFQALPANALDNPDTDMDKLFKLVPSLAIEKYARVVEVVQEKYPTNYLASLFKNATRCKDLVNSA